MASESRSHGARQSGMYLRELLNSTYRDRWARAEFAMRGKSGKPNQAAVAQVLVEYLWDRPRKPEDRDLKPAQLKDLVSRALSGTVLSRQTVQLFVDAFGIEKDDATVLWRQWEEKELARVIFGELPPIEGDAPNLQRYQTISLHEFHYLGPDGRPVRHRTIQDIRALVDGLDSHRYSFDTNEVEVERVQGGTPSAPYRLQGSVWAVDLKLPSVLNRGGMTSMEYVTKFHYACDVEPVFRRVHRLKGWGLLITGGVSA
jgi:hypothetical protein